MSTDPLPSNSSHLPGSSATLITRSRKRIPAGGKARLDIREIGLGLGFALVDLDADGSASRKVVRAGIELPGVLRALLARDGGPVVTQYPLGAPFDRVVARVGSRAKIALVHDLDSLRDGAGGAADAAMLAGYDAVIGHTPAMCAWLRERLGNTRVIELGMFDYLLATPTEPPPLAPSPARLVVVGNLDPAKAAYLYSAGGLTVPVTAYGPKADPQLLPAGVAWGGMLDMHQPALDHRDAFGLVWDGRSPDALDGDFGRYLRYNAPHKLSFYLAAGLPVLVPAGSGMAPFVTRHGVGVAVESVAAAAEFARTCSPDVWQQLGAATLRLRADVLAGAHASGALRAALAVGAGP
ncbi:hypothetical protein [uncultured Jatrophihabitans sp.]|uniref:hypothetical protein n=1 Tax=uncultured Jatrophihabitans sp. TaxID=1610747 RepID=UPI0035C9FAF8